MARAKTPRNGKTYQNGDLHGGAATAIAVEEPMHGLEDEIRIRAYELYEKRGGAPGDEKQDWLLAEKEVIRRHGYLSV